MNRKILKLKTFFKRLVNIFYKIKRVILDKIVKSNLFRTLKVKDIEKIAVFILRKILQIL